MTSNIVSSIEVRCKNAFFITAKVALALIVVKNKPTDTSSVIFAKFLGNELRRKLDLRSKEAEELRRDLLTLKQQHLLLKIKYDLQSNGVQAGGEFQNVRDDPALTCTEASIENELKKNVAFMKNVIALKMHQKSWNFDDSKTIDLSMIGVLKALLISVQNTRADEVAVSHLTEFSSVFKGICKRKLINVNKDLICVCVEFASELIRQLTSSDYKFTSIRQEILYDVLTALGTLKPMQMMLLDRLTRSVLTYQKMLSSHCKNRTLVSSYEFNNICNILTTIENILDVYEGPSETLSEVHRALLNGFENSLRELLATFPLVVHYIWKIMAIMEFKEATQQAISSTYMT